MSARAPSRGCEDPDAGRSRFGLQTLESLLEPFTDEQKAAVVRWLAASARLFALLEETRTSAEAISQLVASVKSFTFLDQAPVQEVDVREGPETTLTILSHKMGDAITVRRDYTRDLPRIEAYGSELNLVWTSIIDNAIDAIQDRGELALRTYAGHDHVVVEFQDDGPGIPAEIQQRVFEPFFTTKAVGSGTGLGLYIAYDYRGPPASRPSPPHLRIGPHLLRGDPAHRAAVAKHLDPHVTYHGR